MSLNERLVQLLSSTEQFVSGEKISEELGISRTAVWKQIKKLEAHGYELEAVTKHGYRLLFIPEKLKPSQLEAELQDHRFGHTIHYFDSVTTTQQHAKELAEQGAKEGTVVLAEQQIKGKGRMGRPWHSPYGKGIWMSIILKPLTPIQLAPQLTLLTAVALTEAIHHAVGLKVGIKWPNDILFQGKKLCGILLESTAEDQRLKYVIAGIGIDVNLAAQDYDEELLQKATSMRIEHGATIDRNKLLKAFMIRWEELFKQYELEGFTAIAKLWEQYAVSLGERILIQTAQERFYGVPVRLSERGSIIVRRDDGQEQEIYSAEMGEVNE